MPRKATTDVVAKAPDAAIELIPDAGTRLYRDFAGPVREKQNTEGQNNFGTMTRNARIAVGLDPDTGLPPKAA